LHHWPGDLDSPEKFCHDLGLMTGDSFCPQVRIQYNGTLIQVKQLAINRIILQIYVYDLKKKFLLSFPSAKN
jgi:hypothetical protein